MAVGFKRFLIELITPERAEPPRECSFVSLPAWDGQVGVLAHHAPLVCRLGPGPLTVEIDGQPHRYYVQGGLARVVDNMVTVLAERLVPEEALTAAQAAEQMEQARRMDARDEPARRARQALIDRARAQQAMILRRDAVDH